MHSHYHAAVRAASSRAGRVSRSLALLLLALPLLWGFTFPGSVQRTWRQGDRAFNRKQYAEAEKLYEKARAEHPQEWRLLYNTAVAQAANKNFDKAVPNLQKVATNGPQELREAAEFNTGNCYLAQQKPKEAIEHYQRALYLKPDDLNAKWNLELAKREQKKQQQQQKQEQQQQKQQPKPKPEKPKPKPEQKKMDKEQAERLLQSLSQADKDLQKKLNKQRTPPPQQGRPGRDW